MATECVTEIPQPHVGVRPRKRQRCGWDVPAVSTISEALIEVSCAQKVEEVTSLLSLRKSPFHFCSNLNKKEVIQNNSPPRREDDKDGHFMFSIGDKLTPRYLIHSKMGEGTFGKVLQCWDTKKYEMVAIKVIRGLNKYREAALIEIQVLEHLAKHETTGTCFVQIRNWFDYRNHVCIVFEKLGPSLYDFLRKNGYRPFPVDIVRELARQMLESIAFMHSLCLIHTDLKPENILLVSSEYIEVPNKKCKSCSSEKRLPKSSKIKIIDFGSTTVDQRDLDYIVSTRHYRAPEVILGQKWSYPCDIWSIGCILVELCSGDSLFQTHGNLEHLAMMERVLGPLPHYMLKRADRRAQKYLRHGMLDWPEGAASRESIKAVQKLSHLHDIIYDHMSDPSADDFIDLLQGLLNYDPTERLTAKSALKHPFFTLDHNHHHHLHHNYRRRH